MSEAALELRDVWRAFAGVGVVLRGVTLTLRAGEVAVLAGPNGAGKTTLLRISAGLLRPSSGSAKIKGLDARSREAKRLVGASLQEPLLYPELTVRENIKYYWGLKGLRGDPFLSPRVEEAVERLGLGRHLDSRVEELSYGWRKRVDLLRAMLGEPSLLLLDEPFSGLDSHSREEVARMMVEASRRGSSLLVTEPLGSVHAEVLSAAGARVRLLRLEEGVLREA